ncbi:hypothetical protein WLH_01896 [Escherichia coli O25b:H4]|uniref:Uncharacterized protein n=1 Tax=Escherichia coli O25b:H4 TaxID=941280 RepID=A0A192CBJ5_ECO25|nr:hypothetical protein WLH_01896 [Escherichia coli O25b:H4]
MQSLFLSYLFAFGSHSHNENTPPLEPTGVFRNTERM